MSGSSSPNGEGHEEGRTGSPNSSAAGPDGAGESDADLSLVGRGRQASRASWQNAGRKVTLSLSLGQTTRHLEDLRTDAQEYLGLQRTYTQAATESAARSPEAGTGAGADAATLAEMLSTDAVVSTVSSLESDLEAVRARSCFLRPNSKARTCWDIYVLALLLYVSISVPFRIGFDVDAKPWEFAFVFEIFVDASFLLDLGANFRTARIDSGGTLVHEPRAVANAYLGGWFCVDFLSSLPVGYIKYMFVGSGDGLGHTKLLKVMRLLRVAKMLRLARLTRMLRQHAEDLDAFRHPLALGKIGAMMFFASHVIACVWFAIALGSASATPPRSSWLDDTELLPLNTSSIGDQYATSLYWATTTLTLTGCPDIVPTTTGERCFTAFTVVLGVCGLTSFLAELASIALHGVLDPIQMEQHRRQTLVRDYLKRNRVQSETRTAVRRQLLHSFEENGVTDEAHVLSLLPADRAEELVRSIHGENFRLLKSALGENFRETDPILHDLAVTLQHQYFAAGQVIYTKGDVGNAMFIVLEGCCEHDNSMNTEGEGEGSPPELLGRGSCFGDDSILNMADGPDGRERTSTVRAGSSTHSPQQGGVSASTSTAAIDRSATSAGGGGGGASDGCKLGVLHRESLRELFIKHPNMEAKLTRGFTRRVFKATKMMWHFFLSHKQANGGNTVASLHAMLREKHVLSWYDNDIEDRSEEGMMQGVRRSAVFLLFLTEGAMCRPFVQKELREAFRQRKPMIWLYETDERFGAADIYAEASAEICRDESTGRPILSREQFEWFFGQLVGIPYRREKHEQETMMGKIVHMGKLAAAGRPSSGVKTPPEHLVDPDDEPTSTDDEGTRSPASPVSPDHGARP